MGHVECHKAWAGFRCSVQGFGVPLGPCDALPIYPLRVGPHVDALLTDAGPAKSGGSEKVHGPNLGVFLSDDAEKVKRLGLPAGLVPYWQADDPSDAWYAADKQARAVYTK